MSMLLSPVPTASRLRVLLPLCPEPSETTRRPSVAARHIVQTHQRVESPGLPHNSRRCCAHVPMNATARQSAPASGASANRGTPVPAHRTGTKAASTSTTSHGAAPRALARSRSRGTSNIEWHRQVPAIPPRSACFCLVLSRSFLLCFICRKGTEYQSNHKMIAVFFYYFKFSPFIFR